MFSYNYQSKLRYYDKITTMHNSNITNSTRIYCRIALTFVLLLCFTVCQKNHMKMIFVKNVCSILQNYELTH